jgi:hypothetical protein
MNWMPAGFETTPALIVMNQPHQKYGPGYHRSEPHNQIFYQYQEKWQSGTGEGIQRGKVLLFFFIDGIHHLSHLKHDTRWFVNYTIPRGGITT